MKLQLSKDQVQLQLSKDRVRRTEIRHTESTKQRKYTINKLVETGKILLHNIKSVEGTADTSAASVEEDNKSSKSDEDTSSKSDDDITSDSDEKDSDYEDDSGE